MASRDHAPFPRMTLWSVCCLLLPASVFVLLSACAADSGSVSDPIEVAFDREQTKGVRVRAIRAIWSDVEAGRLPRGAARERLKDIFWDYAEWPSVRRVAMDALLDDEQGADDTRRMLLLALPTEPSEDIARRIVELIREGHWKDAKVALVRSLVRGGGGVGLEDRPEAQALRELFPGRTLASLAFEVFATTTVAGDSRERDLLARRTREDAWTLVNLTVSGPDELRDLIASAPPSSDDPWLGVLRRAERELGVVPMSGSELDWLVMLGEARYRPWWDETRRAVASLSEADRRVLALRHLEPVRFAFAHRPDLLRSTRNELLSIAHGRLAGRRVVERSADRIHRDRGNDERLEDWQDTMNRLDLLTLLLVDECIAEPGVRRVFFGEVEADLREKRSEFGGLIRTRDDGSHEARAYRPRSSERGSDSAYIAPPDLVADSVTALAQWHLHAREPSSRAYAGPSRSDLLQCARSGRTSLVLTTLGRDRLNCDLYLPTGAVIDLGVIEPAQ